jgi:hypothetical protein
MMAEQLLLDEAEPGPTTALGNRALESSLICSTRTYIIFLIHLNRTLEESCYHGI